MAEIITVISGKGGVGKSTFCVNTALSLVEKGKRVLLVDGDIGLGSLDLLLSVDDMVVYNWLDVIEGRCDINKARLFYNDSLQLLPSPIEYPENFSEKTFADMLASYRVDYDYIFIDSPAGVGDLPKIYVKCSDRVIVVATADETSARSACVAGNTAVSLGVGEKNLRLVINRFDIKALRKGKLLNIDEMIDRTYIRLLGVVPEESDLKFTSVTEKQLEQYSQAKMAFSDIADRILGKEIPIYL